ncbi:MAG: type 2 isopentenyl-diphosphate Delta-isomerase [Deltaproteobacteria bacterium]|nr:type 2 isopentenyl-diphosphate Delta-isomerase [Deltaproteobacteria bacterium]
MSDETIQRKVEHLEVALSDEVESNKISFWQDVELIHTCLPEIDIDEIDLSVSFLGWKLKYPFILSALTGGCKRAEKINRVLAEVAKHFSVGMQLGSGRVLFENEAYLHTYRIARDIAPEIPLFANIGVPQINKQNFEKIKRMVESIGADGLVVHLNFLQEALMIEGEPFAKDRLSAIENLVKFLSVPVIVKETGCGISREIAMKLKDLGVSALDVAGKGGTSMALIELKRAKLRNNLRHERLCRIFSDWGIPTPISIIEAKTSGLPIIGSGGIRTGLDAAKAIALGADLVGMARPLLLWAQVGTDKVIDGLEIFFNELKIAMFLTGSRNLSDLRKKRVLIKGQVREWI